MFDKASLKLGLDKAVLQSMSGREGSIAGIQQFSKKEIEDLLRKGAYAAIMDEDDEGAKFCEEDIEQILLRRSTTITIESEGKGSTFSKVSLESVQVCPGVPRCAQVCPGGAPGDPRHHHHHRERGQGLHLLQGESGERPGVP
ncbi:chromodomain-helicase-DNA-binding protein 8-like, partial [Parus major]|uniref:chromodomain-helicase-DNA-binding protein 8-like n=1 Tax=Parus major TaxID=9157 RepID=UPI001443CAD2